MSEVGRSVGCFGVKCSHLDGILYRKVSGRREESKYLNDILDG